MSKISEIKAQYEYYLAALEATKEFDPDDLEVVYKKGERYFGDDGYILFDPRNDVVKIFSRRSTHKSVDIDFKDVPALAKSLWGFVE
jgi:hypothetical protein